LLDYFGDLEYAVFGIGLHSLTAGFPICADSCVKLCAGAGDSGVVRVAVPAQGRKSRFGLADSGCHGSHLENIKVTRSPDSCLSPNRPVTAWERSSSYAIEISLADAWVS